MKQLTADLPKPMIPVGGVPVLERIVTGLTRAGVREFLIVTGYKAEVIRSHFGAGRRWGITIRYVQQEVQDGTGRVVELARKFAGREAFLLGYGDILVRASAYAKVLREWVRRPVDGLLTVVVGEDPGKGAIAVFDRQFHLQELIEKPSKIEIRKLRRNLRNFKPWYNAGIYVFTPRIFEYTARLEKSPRGEYELTDALRQMARDGLKLRGVPISGGWWDVRDPAVLAEVDRRFRGGS